MNFTTEQLQILRSALGLQWSAYVKQLESCNDVQHSTYLCRQIIETVTMYQRVDEVLESEV